MKRVLVVGARKSGVYAALLAKNRGFAPFVTESSDKDGLFKFKKILQENSIPYEIGKHSFDKVKEFDFVVLSPGVPLSSEIVKKIKNENVPFIGEMEFAFQNSPKSAVVAITGTNGKSTTTALTGNIFSFSKFNIVTGGNLGNPYSELLINNPNPDIAVLETSCFQLETIKKFHPKVAEFLNFSEDHLNRYKNMEQYFYYKKRVFANQNSEDFSILNFDDPVLRELSNVLKSQVYFFSRRDYVNNGVYIENNQIVFNDGHKKTKILPLSSVRLRGMHNIENVLASVLSAKLMGVPNGTIKKGVETFKGLKHRLEEVRILSDVLYVNDSKATTPDSTIKALNAFENTIVLIAGGSSKNNDFRDLTKLLNGKVRKLILIGETAADIANSALESGYSDIVFAADLKNAILLAKKIAQSGDVVLLSPACASFDMFKDFEDRGEQFKEIVRSI